MYIFYLKLSTW